MMEQELSSLSMALAFLVSIFMVLWIWKKSKISNTTLNLPPGPSKLPLIGNLHQLISSDLPHHCLRDLAKTYGPLMQLQFGEVTNIIVSSPENAREVMKTHDVILAHRPSLLAGKILFYNNTSIAFAPHGEYWRQLRKICVMELLSAKRVQSFRSVREEEVSKLIGMISSSAGSQINFSWMAYSLTYSIISRAAFGKIWKGREEFVSLVKDISEALGGFSLADLYPSVKLFHVISWMRHKLERMHERLDKLLEDIINEHRAMKAGAKSGTEGQEQDLVDILLNLQDHGDLEFPLTTNNIKAIIQDVFMGGSETSSTTLEWAMSEMIKNPRIMANAQSEIRQVFGRQGNVDEAGLQKLNYLPLVIKETLRMHPPGPLLLPRENSENCKISGYDIPVKSRVIVNVWGIGRDPKYWNEPERFYPERFLDGSMDYKGTNFEFIPFGAGRRMCPGILFGMANVELPLAHLLYHFDWKLPNELKPAELDMSEAFGAAVKRKSDLFLVPIPHIFA